MAARFHLESIGRLGETISFTLVVESKNYYVEQFRDAHIPFFKGRLKIIRPPHLKNYQVRGALLSKLVATKMRQLQVLRRRFKSSSV